MQTDPVYACVYASIMQNNVVQKPTVFIVLLKEKVAQMPAAEQPQTEAPQPAVQRARVRHHAGRLRALAKEAASCILFQLGCFAWVCADTDPVPYWVAGALVLIERRAHVLRRVERAVVALRCAPASCMYCFAASVVPGWVLPAELTWASASASAD
jgi:hypothetical protein